MCAFCEGFGHKYIHKKQKRREAKNIFMVTSELREMFEWRGRGRRGETRGQEYGEMGGVECEAERAGSS